MKINNVHIRQIDQPIDRVWELIKTLATKEDQVWPYELWPRMKLDNGHQIGSKGGHGIIKYFVRQYIPKQLIEFQFTQPVNIDGIHKLELEPLANNRTQLSHTLEANVSGFAVLSWISFIRPFHDALLEDAFDKVQNYFSNNLQKTPWSNWVKLWRFILR